MCGKLSSTSRLTAICLMSSMPVVFGRCCSGVFSGWNASGMNVWKPPVSSCKRAQLEQVVDAVFVVLDVAVEHGRVRFQADLVRRSRGLQPLAAVDLVIADDVPHAVGKNLGAAAGQRIDARVFQLVPASRESTAWPACAR